MCYALSGVGQIPSLYDGTLDRTECVYLNAIPKIAKVGFRKLYLCIFITKILG